MAEKIQDIDHGWKRILRGFQECGKSYTKVGLQDGDESDEGTGLAMIAAFNEFGTETIPERPFMKQAFDINRGRIENLQSRLNSAVLLGKISIEKALFLVGEEHQKHIQKRIKDLTQPQNKPSTIKKKGSSNPLIDTAQMMQSVRHIEVINE